MSPLGEHSSLLVITANLVISAQLFKMHVPLKYSLELTQEIKSKYIYIYIRNFDGFCVREEYKTGAKASSSTSIRQCRNSE